jgi:nicotinamide phosphoribosyltransferase
MDMTFMKHDFVNQSTALFDNAVFLDNIIFDTDSYKQSHTVQYPAGTRHVSSYVEARSAFGNIKNLKFFGLQMELALLRGVQVTREVIDQAIPFLQAHGYDIYVDRWEYIMEKHGGRLPVKIEAISEGTIVPVSIPQIRITNTDPECFWLVSFLETRLLRAIWYATTVSTVSAYIKNEISSRMMITDGSIDGLEFKLHDFGARGTTSRDTAGRGGAAHLVNFWGTDTISGLVYARNYYGADMAGFSIPASEHSTMTALGRDGEHDQVENMLDQFPEGLVAIVSDSYDLFALIKEAYGNKFKDKIMNRNGTLVVRPDSGNPVEIVPAVIEALMTAFGFKYTASGYKLLNQKVRVLQGDGINHFSIVKIMDTMMERGLAIGNIAFGMGGALLQAPNRDDFGYAMKASAIDVNGEWHDVYKDPKTAKGSKTSKKGIQGAFRTDSGDWVARRVENLPPNSDMLTSVFENGELTKIWTFDEVRAASNGYSI